MKCDEQQQQSRPKFWRWLGYGAFCAVAVALGTVGGFINRSKNVKEAILQTVRNVPPQEIFKQDSMTVLVLGCDEDRAPGGAKVTTLQARSDMMLLARTDFQNQKLSGLSIARDIYYKFPNSKDGHKINAYHRYGGNALAKQAVENLLGVKIDRVVVLDFDAFEQLVNIVGGVDLVVDKDLKYTDKAGGLYIDIKKGAQHLDGYNSMCFVRYRHGDSDLNRQARQKQFMLALKEQVRRNPKLIEAVSEMGQRVLGNEFSTPEAIALARFAQQIPSTNVKLGQVSVNEIPHSTMLSLNKKKTAELLREYGLVDSPTPAERTARKEMHARSEVGG